jgi:hypothetical protein
VIENENLISQFQIPNFLSRLIARDHGECAGFPVKWSKCFASGGFEGGVSSAAKRNGIAGNGLQILKRTRNFQNPSPSELQRRAGFYRMSMSLRSAATILTWRMSFSGLDSWSKFRRNVGQMPRSRFGLRGSLSLSAVRGDEFAVLLCQEGHGDFDHATVGPLDGNPGFIGLDVSALQRAAVAGRPDAWAIGFPRLFRESE